MVPPRPALESLQKRMVQKGNHPLYRISIEIPPNEDATCVRRQTNPPSAQELKQSMQPTQQILSIRRALPTYFKEIKKLLFKTRKVNIVQREST